MKTQFLATTCTLLTLASFIACGQAPKTAIPKSSPSAAAEATLPTDESAASLVAGVLAGAIASTDNLSIAGSLTASLNKTRSWISIANDLLTPLPNALADVVCPSAGLGKPTNGKISGDGTVELDYSDCHRVGSGSVWNGIETLNFDSLNTLTAYQTWTASQLLSSGQVVRTFGGTIGSLPAVFAPTQATYRTAVKSGRMIFVDTQNADVVCYSGAVGCPKQTGIKTSFLSSQQSQIRIVEINGVRLAGVDNVKAKVPVWDNVITSDPIVVMNVGTSKTVPTSGEIRVFHNSTNYMTTSRVTQPLSWNISNALTTCHPSSGQITTTCLAGNDETLTFIGGDSATLVDCSGKASVVKLKHCL